jgi:DNA repair protein RadC
MQEVAEGRAACARSLDGIFPEPDKLADRDLLHILLRPLSPPDQCCALAESLWAREGSLRAVLECSSDTLVDTVGQCVAHHLRCIGAAVRRVLLEDLKERPLVNCWSELESYLRAAFQFDLVEKRSVLFLNSSNLLIRQEVLQVGPIGDVPGYLRRIVARTLQIGASAIIVVHSQPGHNATPSSKDVQLAKQLATMLGMLGVLVHDHAIVGKHGVMSLREMNRSASRRLRTSE